MTYLEVLGEIECSVVKFNELDKYQPVCVSGDVQLCVLWIGDVMCSCVFGS